MTTPTLKLYPYAPLEKDDLEQRLEKTEDVISFNNSITTVKEMSTYFKIKITNK